MNTDQQIEAIRSALRERGENDDFILSSDWAGGAGGYVAQACNSTSYVALGEIEGKYRAEGKTPGEAVAALYALIVK